MSDPDVAPYPRPRRPVPAIGAALLGLAIGFLSGWIARGRTGADRPSAPNAPPVSASGAPGATGAARSAAPAHATYPPATGANPGVVPPQPALPFERREGLRKARETGTPVPLEVGRPSIERAATDPGPGPSRVRWKVSIRNPEGFAVQTFTRIVFRTEKGIVVCVSPLEDVSLAPGEIRVLVGESTVPREAVEKPERGPPPSPLLPVLEYQAYRPGGPAPSGAAPIPTAKKKKR